MKRVYASASLFCSLNISVWATTLSVPSQYATITAAVAVAKSGDTILIQSGVHKETVNLSGIKSIHFQGQSADATILEPNGSEIFSLDACSSLTFSNMTLRNCSGSGIYFQLGCHDLIFKGLNFTNVEWGIESLRYNYNIYVRDCFFQNGLRGNRGVHCMLEGNTNTLSNPGDYVIEDCSFLGIRDAVFSDRSPNVTVRRNTFLNCKNSAIGFNSSYGESERWAPCNVYENIIQGGPVGLFVQAYNDETLPPNFFQTSTAANDFQILIYNNVITGTTKEGFYGYGIIYNETQVYLRNNIFYQNTGTAIYADRNLTSQTPKWNSRVFVNYDTFYGNVHDFGGGISSLGKGDSAYNQYTDPLFTDPASGNYTLKTGSPCIDTGTLDVNGDGVNDITSYKGTSRDRGVAEQ